MRVTETILAAGLIGLSLTSVMVTVTVTVAVRPCASPTTSGSRRVGSASRSSGLRDVTTARPRPSSPPDEKMTVKYSQNSKHSPYYQTYMF